MKKNRLLLIESEMIEPKGHFLNHLIDASKFYEGKFSIYWILNKKFDDEGVYMPKKIKKIFSISTNKFKRKNNKFFYIFEEIFIFLLNIFYTIFFLFYFTINNKLLFYLNALKSNYFIIPKYFKSFYFSYKSLKLNRNDHILFPTGRRKDLALINFLSKIDTNHPKFHLRIFIPQRNKFKGFFYYLKQIDCNLKNKNIFIYAWRDNFKLFLKNTLSKKGIYKTNLMFSSDPSLNFKRKFKKTNHVIGYLGHARKERGFHYLPKLIKILEKKNNNFNYLIQFSKINKDLMSTKMDLYKLRKKNKRIKIINKYSDYNDFIKYLKKIDIMPILHNPTEINNITSGTAYSCIPYEIPTVLPYGTNFLSNINKSKSFEKAKDIESMADQINKISKNYKFYLKNAKLNSKLLSKIVKNDPLTKNLN